jgi:hypothetical protein
MSITSRTPKKNLVSTAHLTFEAADEDQSKKTSISSSTKAYLDQLRNQISEKYGIGDKNKVAPCTEPLPIYFDPDKEYMKDLMISSDKVPDATNFYLRRVYLIVPHLNFPRCKSEIICSKCNNPMSSKGWNKDARTIHDIYGSCHLLLFRYTCSNQTCTELTKEYHCYSMKDDLINYKIDMPKYFRELYGIQVTSKSGYTNRLMQLIISDSLTSKSFFAIGEGIKSCRVAEYQRRRGLFVHQVEYYVKKLSAEHKHSRDTKKFLDEVKNIPEFSAMDDPLGYNELLRVSDNYIIMLFEKWVTDRADVITAFMDTVPVHAVLKIDHTFRTPGSVFVDDMRERVRLPSSNKALVTMIYGNCQMAYQSLCTGETHTSIETGIKEIIERAKKQGNDPPVMVFTDDCCSTRNCIQEVN